MAKPKRVQKNATKDKNIITESKKKAKDVVMKTNQKKKPQLKKEKIKLAIKEDKQKIGNHSGTNHTKEETKKTKTTSAVNLRRKKTKETAMDNLNKEPYNESSRTISNSQSQEVRNPMGNSSKVVSGSKAGRKRSLPSSVEAGMLKKKKIIDKRSPFPLVSGVVLTLGQGDVGQLGLGPDTMERKRPALVALENIVDIYAGGMHTVCLSANGEVFTFGCNDEGALGRETENEEGSEYMPGKVNIPGKVLQICAGDSHTAALTEEGQAYAWGSFRDSSGSMGLLTPSIQRQPQKLLTGITVVKIASGSDHLVLLTSEGHLYTCGCAEQGQLGRVAECFSARGGRKGLALLLNPGLVFTRRLQGKELFFDDVWTGAYCTYAKVKSSGDIYVCGLNNYYQLGTEDMQNRYVLERSVAFKMKQWQEIAGGQHHTLALDAAGQVYSIGRHEYGRLGLGEEVSDTTRPTFLPDLQNVNCVKISCGVATSYAIAENGSVYAWGMGTNGALGTGDEDDRTRPVIMAGKQLENRKAVAVSGGGQHCVILAVPQSKDEKK